MENQLHEDFIRKNRRSRLIYKSMLVIFTITNITYFSIVLSYFLHII